MAGTNINRVILTGNLTRDPELRATSGGLSVCSLRLATNTRRKNNQTGDWEDKANYVSVTIFGRQGENAAQFLSKGRPVAIDGRLEWREWQTQSGEKREQLEVIADNIQFLGGRDDAMGGGGNGGGFAPRSDVPVDTNDFAPAAVGGSNGGGSSAPADDDIPFYAAPPRRDGTCGPPSGGPRRLRAPRSPAPAAGCGDLRSVCDRNPPHRFRRGRSEPTCHNDGSPARGSRSRAA